MAVSVEPKTEIQRESALHNQQTMQSLSCLATGVEEEIRPRVIPHFP